ncbi:hypothetical protein CF319_g209 [Tilletia indica]|nr:hypothetical protein CF319_g209 [Tilletia indica]
MFMVPRSERERARNERRRGGASGSGGTSGSGSKVHHAGIGRRSWSILCSPKLLCLLALAVQNAALVIVMHHSRVSVPPEKRYYTATAVLFVELLKGAISLLVAFYTVDPPPQAMALAGSSSKWNQDIARMKNVVVQVGSPDCMKLAIPAALYVLQQRLQYTAAANLDPTTFTVSYQAKVLTTAFFSFVLLRTRIRTIQWIALFGLALGVAVVQIQSLEARQAISTLGQTMATQGNAGESFLLSQYRSTLHGISNPFSGRGEQTQPTEERPYHAIMNPFIGFLAVGAACMTSGFAGVYFEMLLKGRAGRSKSQPLPQHVLPTHAGGARTSQSDHSVAIQLENLEGKSAFSSSKAKANSSSSTSPFLRYQTKATEEVLPSLWIRNVQLSLLSLPPALFPVLLAALRHGISVPFAHITHPAALLTIAMQVIGGILTALVIKHADNILKGFAVAFSVLLSFAWSAFVLGSSGDGADGTGGMTFNGWFFLGSALTLASTFLYNCQSVEAQRGSVGGDRQRERSRSVDGVIDKGNEREGSVSPASSSSSLVGIQSEQPVTVSSVWSSHRQHTVGGSSTSTQIGGSGTSPSPPPDPSSAYNHNGNGRMTSGSSSASFGAPRLMAEAEAAWATVVSYSQIPLATASYDDEDDTHDGQRRGEIVRASERVAEGKEERDRRRLTGSNKARTSIDSEDSTTPDTYSRRDSASAAAVTAAQQSLLPRLPHSSASSPRW